MSLTVSPLAPTEKPHLPALAGVRLAAIEAGLRYVRLYGSVVPV